jgi:TolB protein
MDTAGTNVRQLTSPPGTHTSPSWSKDGTKIVFVSTRDAIQGEVYVMDADGGSAQRVTSDSSVKDYPVLTPDGKAIVYTVYDGQRHAIVSMDLESQRVHHLTPLAHESTTPRLSSDGDLVLFASNREHLMAAFSMTRTGENVLRLSPLNTECTTPAWGPSERVVFYSRNGGIYRRLLDSQKEAMLSTKGDSFPHWVRD